MTLDEITGQIVDAAYKVHTALGPGLLESAYEACLLFELHQRGLQAVKQLELPVIYQGVQIEIGYRIDLLVENQVILELKVVEKLLPLHEAQLLTYLKLSQKQVGFLLNFNTVSMKNGIKRLVNRYHPA